MILSRVAFEARVSFAGRGMPIPKFKRSFEHSGRRSPRQDRALTIGGCHERENLYSIAQSYLGWVGALNSAVSLEPSFRRIRRRPCLLGEPKSHESRAATLFAPIMVLVASRTEIRPVKPIFCSESDLRNLIPGLAATSGTIERPKLLVFKRNEKSTGIHFQTIGRRASCLRHPSEGFP